MCLSGKDWAATLGLRSVKKMLMGLPPLVNVLILVFDDAQLLEKLEDFKKVNFLVVLWQGQDDLTVAGHLGFKVDGAGQAGKIDVTGVVLHGVSPLGTPTL